MNHSAKGRAGEDAALAFLLQKGMVLLARNVRLSGGEVDLILRDGKYTVFVEVKRRDGGRFGQGREAVSPQKMRRISAAALAWATREGLLNTPLRFDVVEVQQGRVTHLVNAFSFVG